MMNRVPLLLFVLGYSFGLPSSLSLSGDGTGTRIIGGDEVVPTSVPYQAAVLLNGTFVCGGSLISTKVVLTAGHCAVAAVFAVVVLGAHDLRTIESTQQRFNTSDILVHENYTEFLENDVALVLLPEAAQLTTSVQIVELAPTSAPSYTGSSAYLTGWGMTHDASDTSPYLLVRPSNVCTSGVGVVGACHSDSGGPLVVDGVQVGIVSFGSGSCVDESPTGFVRVSYYRDWILEHAGV
ncbi:hypothetical protein NQ315_016161 [Exocentrus adspersus]|uniref:Peptidase S1 domain-containing protein n=1 Tax=Exocentrus adspersus TaxID=1586481 RepID=A0AAV8VGB2_9CUCU|nr:hypothetical protein NQ315_016161 [Exocentrus adspersus]